MKLNEPSESERGILGIAAVAATCDLSKATIYRLMKAGQFPAAMPLVPGGRRVGWRSSDVQRWADNPLGWVAQDRP